MADGISYVVAQRSDGEGKFTYALSVSQKGQNKVRRVSIDLRHSQMEFTEFYSLRVC